jgi:murein tripeptide amidase MpaA
MKKKQLIKYIANQIFTYSYLISKTGIFNLLMDHNDLRAKELRKRYVFKIIPILNPDGVYRGHFRMDQHGQNLNRYLLLFLYI